MIVREAPEKYVEFWEVYEKDKEQSEIIRERELEDGFKLRM